MERDFRFCAGSTFAGAIWKDRLGVTPIRSAGLRYGQMSGFDQSKAVLFAKRILQTHRLAIVRASRVEPRNLRPMHYRCSAWDFLFCGNKKGISAVRMETAAITAEMKRRESIEKKEERE